MSHEADASHPPVRVPELSNGEVDLSNGDPKVNVPPGNWPSPDGPSWASTSCAWAADIGLGSSPGTGSSVRQPVSPAIDTRMPSSSHRVGTATFPVVISERTPAPNLITLR